MKREFRLGGNICKILGKYYKLCKEFLKFNSKKIMCLI